MSDGVEAKETVAVPKDILQKIHDHFKSMVDGVEHGAMEVGDAAMMVPLLALLLITGDGPRISG